MELTIGRPYTEELESCFHLCSDIEADGRSFTLWFSVDKKYSDFLITDRCDAFFAVLITEAMRKGYTVKSRTPVSSSLLYQFREHLIPTLSTVFSSYSLISIDIPSVRAFRESTGYSARFASYSSGCLTVNAGLDGSFDETIVISSNIESVFPESEPHAVFMRQMAFILSLQNGIDRLIYPRQMLPFSEGWDVNTTNPEEWFEVLATQSFKTEDTAICLMPVESVVYDSKGEIRIGTPYIIKEGGKTKLCADSFIPGCEKKTLFIEVADEYGDYFAVDRADAFILPFIPSAMKNGYDICSEAPVSARLLDQINSLMIPMCSANIDEFKLISIKAEKTCSVLPSEGAVATGCTCGVDSLYTIGQMNGSDIDGYKLTHLIVANCGTLESDDNEKTLDIMAAKMENGIAKELGLPVMKINSNLDLIFPDETYLAVAMWRLPALFLSLQKLFGVILFSSSYEYTRFAFEVTNCDYYETFLFPCLDLDRLRFYPSGSQVRRIDKISMMSDWDIAKKYLHPCIYVRKDINCGHCGKCIRTFASLYGMGKLDDFSRVLDVDEFRKGIDLTIAKIISNKNQQHYGECYVVLRDNGLITKRSEELAAVLSRSKRVIEKNKDEITKRLATGLKISVLIVAYQAEKYLASSINSVLSQTYKPFEIIVVDDGSTDGTGQVAKSFSNVRYIRAEHKGIANARNLAVSEASGDYVAYLDADDMWMPDKLEKQVSYITSHPGCSIVFTHYENFTDIPAEGLTDRQKAVLDKVVYPYLASALIKKDVFSVYGFFDTKYTYGEDTEWLKRLQFAGLDISSEIPEVLYRRRIHDQNITLSHKTPGQKEILSLMADAIRHAEQIKKKKGEQE